MLSAILDSLHEQVLAIDTNGKFVLSNQAARQNMERNIGQVLEGRSGTANLPAYYHDTGERMPHHESPLPLALLGKTTSDLMLDIEYPRTGLRTISMSARPLRDSKGRARGAVTTIRDVTDLLQVEQFRRHAQELETQNQLIREANRLKSEFLANMSHELRTPLNAIIGFSELFATGAVTSDMPEFQEFVADILQSGRHLLRLINDLLDISKVEAGKMAFTLEEVNVAQLVNAALAVFRPNAAPRGVTMVADLPPDLPAMFTDPGRLTQVLCNYLSNALKFSPPGEKIVVTVGLVGRSAIRFSVTDRGPGIPADALPRLFQPFEQLETGASKEFGGPGLGLALNRRMVEAQGGTVGVHSVEGQGSTFFATFPLNISIDGALADTRRVPGSQPHAIRILVVEDNPEEQAQLLSILATGNFDIEAVVTGVQAQAQCEERRFDAIILDLVLPDTLGFDLIRDIRRSPYNKATPIVVVSRFEHHGGWRGFGISDYLRKPVEEDGLLDALRRATGDVAEHDTVLMIEDDPHSSKVLATAVTHLGFSVRGFHEAEQALAWLKDHPAAAVILDLILPGMSGFDFLVAISDMPHPPPVIVWTVKDLSREELELLRGQTKGILHKSTLAEVPLLTQLRRILPLRPVSDFRR